MGKELLIKLAETLSAIGYDIEKVKVVGDCGIRKENEEYLYPLRLTIRPHLLVKNNA